ncbi:hypothetical protein D3C84_1084770 [compost metagenome]
MAARLPLKLRHGSAGGRLRQGKLLGSAGNALLLGDGDEYLELTEGKSHIYITDNLYLDNPVNRYCGGHYNVAQLRPFLCGAGDFKFSEPRK